MSMVKKVKLQHWTSTLNINPKILYHKETQEIPSQSLFYNLGKLANYLYKSRFFLSQYFSYSEEITEMVIFFI